MQQGFGVILLAEEIVRERRMAAFEASNPTGAPWRPGGRTKGVRAGMAEARQAPRSRGSGRGACRSSACG